MGCTPALALRKREECWLAESPGEVAPPSCGLTSSLLLLLPRRSPPPWQQNKPGKSQVCQRASLGVNQKLSVQGSPHLDKQGDAVTTDQVLSTATPALEGLAVLLAGAEGLMTSERAVWHLGPDQGVLVSAEATV